MLTTAGADQDGLKHSIPIPAHGISLSRQHTKMGMAQDWP